MPAIPLRDVPMTGRYRIANAPRLRIDGNTERYLVHDGDVLFRSRGDRNTAVLAQGDDSEEAVALLPLIILRADREKLLPAYLAWYINQAPAQRHFDACARGTSMRMIPRDCLATLPVPIPPLERQKLIAETATLIGEEQALSHALAEKRASLITHALISDAATCGLFGKKDWSGQPTQPKMTGGEST